MTLAAKTASSDWQSIRQQAAAYFAKLGFPSKSDEAWKYTSLRQLPEELLNPAARTEQGLCARDVWAADHHRLALVDGYVHSLESRLPEGVHVEVCDLNNPAGEVEQLFFAEKLSHESAFERAGHVALNRAKAPQAVVIRVHSPLAGESNPAKTDLVGGQFTGAQIASPPTASLRPDGLSSATPPRGGSDTSPTLELHHILTSAAANLGSFPQIWLVLEAGAELTLIECFYGDIAEAHLQNIVVNIVLEEGAKLTHIRSQSLPETVTHLYSAHLELQANSRYHAFSLMSGAATSRQEVQAFLLGEGAHCDQQGVILGDGKQHHDAYLPVYHHAPGCYSNQHFRQLLDGQSTGIFYGRVEVPQTSPRTEAHQMNKNLLLSEAASVYTRPELDILTDEVVCSHGATTGNLDEQALYYLQARGIPFAQARALLTQGFVNELLDGVELEAVREALCKEIGV